VIIEQNDGELESFLMHVTISCAIIKYEPSPTMT